MAKQMKRVEKRYVPQQESYRNLPGLRPQASPVDVTPEAPIDSSAEKLRQLADGLSSLNKGLGDFLRMEKSFEETNRLANRTNAALGLPPVPGEGFLDLGVEAGRREGQGMADSLDIVDSLQQELDANGYFIDLGDPKGSIANLQTYIDDKIKSTLGERAEDSNYMRGAAAELTKFKVKAVSEAAVLFDAQKKAQTLNNEAKNMNATIGALSVDVWRDPVQLRSVFSSSIMGATARGLDRAAASSLMLQVITDRLTNEAEEAHDMGDLEKFKEAIFKLQAAEMAAVTKDSGGQPLGGSFKVDKEGKPKQVLEAEVTEIRSEKSRLVTKMERLKKDTKDLKIAEGQNVIFEDLKNNVPREDIEKKLEVFKDSPDVLKELRSYMQTIYSSGAAIMDDDLRESLRVSGNYDIRSLNKMVADGRLSSKSANELMSVKAKEQAQTNRLLYTQRLIENSNNAKLKTKAQQVAQENAGILAQALTEMINLEPGALSHVNNYVSQKSKAGEPVDLEMLKSVGSSRDMNIRKEKELSAGRKRIVDEQKRIAKEKLDAILGSRLDVLAPVEQRELSRKLEAREITPEAATRGFLDAENAARKFQWTPQEEQLYEKSSSLEQREYLETKKQVGELTFKIHSPATPRQSLPLLLKQKADASRKMQTYEKRPKTN